MPLVEPGEGVEHMSYRDVEGIRRAVCTTQPLPEHAVSNDVTGGITIGVANRLGQGGFVCVACDRTLQAMSEAALNNLGRFRSLGRWS